MGALVKQQRTFIAVSAQQAQGKRVFTFAATADEILAVCEISRAGRTDEGKLFGFQRPQIASHIQEIRDYLLSAEAVLPNAIVVGFMGGVKVKKIRDGVHEMIVTTSGRKPGFVVDGQQRLTALAQSKRGDFQVFVSCVLCDDDEELRRQFILINNTRPLPKSLIYELLPEVPALPRRLSARAFAASLAERLNYNSDSSLHGMVAMHTNPAGIIKDTSLQKVIMNSADSGALRDYSDSATRPDFGFKLLSNFYGAVQDVFPEDWHGQTPRTSRLVHGAGVIAMGFVMETLYSLNGAKDRASFTIGLQSLKKKVAWSSGTWSFHDGSVLKWNEIENTPKQIQRLALHLVSLVKKQRAKPSRKRAS